MTPEEYSAELGEILSRKELKPLEEFLERNRDIIGDRPVDMFLRGSTKQKMMWMCDMIMARTDMSESDREWAWVMKMEIWDDIQSFEEPEDRA